MGSDIYMRVEARTRLTRSEWLREVQSRLEQIEKERALHLGCYGRSAEQLEQARAALLRQRDEAQASGPWFTAWQLVGDEFERYETDSRALPATREVLERLSDRQLLEVLAKDAKYGPPSLRPTLTPVTRDALRQYEDERRSELDPAVREDIIEMYARHPTDWVRCTRTADEPPFMTDALYNVRCYSLFAMLAGERNPKPGDPGHVRSISEPRGTPEDVSAKGRTFMFGGGEMGHRLSHLTLAELEAADWDQPLAQRHALVREEQYLQLRDHGDVPWPWVDAVGTRSWKARAFTRDGYDAWVSLGRPWFSPPVEQDQPDHQACVDRLLLQQILNGRAAGQPSSESPRELEAYVRAEWQETPRHFIGAFLTDALPQLRSLAERRGIGPDDVRILFFFIS